MNVLAVVSWPICVGLPNVVRVAWVDGGRVFGFGSAWFVGRLRVSVVASANRGAPRRERRDDCILPYLPEHHQCAVVGDDELRCHGCFQVPWTGVRYVGCV